MPSGRSAVDEPLTETAPAKLNLALHVVGRRDDGYHLIDTLVVFAKIADRLTARPAPDLTLDLDGPFASALPRGEDNLVLRAARMLQADRRVDAGARLELSKCLPVAAGIGGGSADAAATLRLLNRMWGCDLDSVGLAGLAARLGADVPMCLHSRPLRAGGIGGDIRPLAGLQALDLVLVNPGRGLSTADIFAALPERDSGGIGEIPPGLDDVAGLAAYLRGLRNDLEAAALPRVPEIATVEQELGARPGCLMTRMSGSGPTVFGIFASAADAARAAGDLSARHADWWVAATRAG